MAADRRGSVAVEVALVVPVLCLLVIGGWVAGYMAFAKMALAMAANRAARDFAAAVALHDRLDATDRAYRYDGGFAESFGLPRWAVRALIMRTQAAPGDGVSDQAVVVAMCYRLPLALPGGTRGGSQQAEAASLPDLTAIDPDGLGLGGLLERVGQGYQEIRDEAGQWEQVLRQAEALAARGERLAGQTGWAADLWRQAIEGPPADFTPLEDLKGPDELEQAARRLCEPPAAEGQFLIVTARSAYLLQTVFEP